jgi:hypothetical protein
MTMTMKKLIFIRIAKRDPRKLSLFRRLTFQISKVLAFFIKKNYYIK